MDKFVHYYAWFLLVASGLPGLVRLVQPRQLAAVTSVRIAESKKRTRHRWLGWISILGSAALVPVYFFYSPQRWLLVAFVIGLLTGVEMIGNSARPEEDSLTRQNRWFGLGYAACALLTYFVLLRK